MERSLARAPAWLTPSWPRWRRWKTILAESVLITAPGRAPRSVAIAVTQPLLLVLFFLLALELLLEFLVAVAAVSTLGFFIGTLPIIRAPIHRRKGGEGSFGEVG
jgi:hypothetical protein